MNKKTLENPGKDSSGAAIKKIRQELGLTLSLVSARSGIPVSTLSKIENGKSPLTVDRVACIGVALDVHVTDVLGFERSTDPSGTPGRRSITRRGEESVVPSPYGEYRYHSHDLLEKQFIPVAATIKAQSLADFGDYHRHDGDEFVYVLEGELLLYTDIYSPVHLRKDESIFFDSRMGHAYIAKGSTPCKILIICANDGQPLTRTTMLSTGRQPGNTT
ncbi:helix-turn-helix domain-containing protein [Kineobactrum salinum]|uniref:Helix-turn-helix domain-containing protein n=1 Tax=Kineobactrum salinum TaxID=2708301 RepID=A0A6C0TXP5_9GAMM|nr:XRE family transcriptional regulator [Kineobactrum salinum]QIB64602.1 helix-turn-helix domain-containing protein [Kineobactrum salinum]